MRIAIALIVFSCVSNSLCAANAVTVVNNRVILADGTAIPYEPGKDQLVILSHSNSDKVQVQYLQKGQQRVIVELTDAALLPHLHAFKQQNAALAQPGLAASKQQLETTAELARYNNKLLQQQNRLWSTVRNLAPDTRLHQRHSKLLNALVIDVNEQHLDTLRRMPNVARVSRQQRVYKALSDTVPLIKTPAVWAISDQNKQSVNGLGIDVAVLDTGIDYTHPALGGCLGQGCKVVAGYDFHNQDNDPMDGDGHGTHVAGIIAAESETYSGVAPKVNLHAYKVLSDEGWGNNTAIIAALEYAADPDGDPTTDDAVDVINMSLGGGGDADSPLSRATNAAVEAGIIVVVAAGNGGNFGDIAASSPASAAKAITVASTTKSDQLSDFSSKGESIAGAGLKPELAAPGSDIVAPYLAHNTAPLSGTSMASPHVAGAAALLRQLYPQASVDTIRGMLMAGSVDLGLLPYEQGAGRLDIAAASAVSFYADKGILAFGNLDNSLSHWQSSLALTLQNLTAEDIAITLALSQDIASTMPANVQISWPQQDYVIPANGSLSIDVSLTVNDAQSLPYPDNGAYAFVERLVISSAQQSLTVPVTFDKATELTIKMDNEVAGNLVLHSDDNTFQRNFYMEPASSRTIKVPQKALSAKVLFEAHFPIFYPQFNLPDNVAIHSFDLRRINPTTNTAIEFQLSDIDTLVGFDELLDANGDKADTDDVALNFLSYGNFYYGDNQHYGFFAGGYERPPLLGISSRHSFSYADIGTSGVIPAASATEPPTILLLQRKIEQPAAGLDLFSPSLAQLRNFTVWLPEQQTTDVRTVSYSLHALSGNSISSRINTNFAFANIAVIPELATQSSFDVGVVKDAVPWLDYQARSEQLTPLETKGINAKQFYGPGQITYPGDSIDFRRAGSYFSGTFYSSDSGIQFNIGMPMSFVSFVADINLNRFGHGATNLQLSWFCDGELQQQYPIYPTQAEAIPIPELSCDLARLELGFNSWLHGIPYWSWLTLNEVDITNFSVQAINNISVFEAEQSVSDQIVNQLNARLEIHLPYHAANLNLKAELKLGNGEFMQLTPIPELNNADYANFALPMVAGEHVASIRLTYGYRSHITQTLNGLFLLGADAGEADVDGDGTPNSEDADNDNDGVNDTDDAFPYDPTEWLDTDGDGIGNNADTDDDNDGYPDTEDAFPLDATEWLDTDGDGIGNNADPDDDNDGVADTQDAFPLDASRSALPTPPAKAKDSGGGSLSLFWLLWLALLPAIRRKNLAKLH